MTRDRSRRRVAVIGAGGTISYRARSPLDLFEYADGGSIQTAAELVESLPATPADLDLVPVAFRALSSTRLAPSDWLELNRLIYDVATGPLDPDGLVLTHGTATLEETAYFLDLAMKIETPLVIVGAQRPSGSVSSDGSLNLINACRAAAALETRGLGVMVLLNDEVHAARDVTKTSTWRVDAFRSPGTGPLGYADPDRVVIYRRPGRRHTIHTEFDPRGVSELPRVDIAYSYAGADGTAIEAFRRAGARAIVVASLPPARLTPGEFRAAAEACESGITVILSTRAGSGRVIRSEALRHARFVAADDLNPQKARVLAALALTRAANADEIQAIFDTY